MIWKLMVSKDGYFLPVRVKVGLKKVVLPYFLSQFYGLSFQTKCWPFETKNITLSLFLAFLAVVFSQFCLNVI